MSSSHRFCLGSGTTPKDVQWIGGGGAVDAIVWNGLEAGGDVEIVFLPVKAGPRARLTSNQRRIREAIAWKRIAFEEYRPPETPLLINALPSDDADELLPEDQAEEEARACEITASEVADAPVSLMNEMIAGMESGP